MVDVRPQLLGRGTYGPDRMRPVRGPRHLWNHVAPPPAGNSIIIYKDGSILEGNNFAGWEIDPVVSPDVHRYIPGGTRVACEDLDEFSRNALIAAGYQCGQPADVDVYPVDDQYPVDDTYPVEGTS